MADEVDIANERAQEILEEALLKRHPPGPKRTGACLWCAAVCADRWCDVECRDDWEYEQRRLATRGNGSEEGGADE